VETQIKKELSGRWARGGLEMSLIEDKVGAGFDTARAKVNVLDLSGSGSEAKENAIVGMFVKLGRALARDAGGNKGAKDTEMGKVRLCFCPGFKGGATKGGMPQTVLQVNGVDKSRAPVLRRKASRVKKRAHHDAKSAIEAFDLAILMWAVAASGFQNVASSMNGLSQAG
jgi:hypothetical protein